MWELTANSTPIPPAGIYADDRRARAIAALLVTMDQSAVIEETVVFLRSGDNLAVITFVPQVAIADVIDFFVDDHGREHRRFRADVLGTADFDEQCWAVLALINSAEIQMTGSIPPLPDNLPPLPADIRRKPVKSSADPDILRPIIKDWTRREKVKFSIRDLIDKVAIIVSGDFLDDDGDTLSYGGTWTPDVRPEIQPDQVYRLDITYARLSWPVAGGKISKFCRGLISIPTPERMREKMYPITIDDGVAKNVYGKKENESLVISPVIIQFSHMALEGGEK